MAIIKIQPYIVDETQNFTFNNVTATGNILSLNANLGNLVTANYFSGSGANLTSIPGANVSGQVGNALVAGTVYTASQPNITSVGTLSSVSVSGNANIGNIGTGGIITATGNITGGNLVTSGLANLGSLSVTGVSDLGAVGNVKISGGTNGYVLSTDGASNLSWVAQSGGGGGASISNGTSNVNITTSGGNVTTSVAGNANIVVVTGTGVNVAGTLSASGNINGGNIVTAGEVSATGNVTANFYIGNGALLTGITTTGLANGNSNISIPAANGNINFSATGNANVLVVTGTGINVSNITSGTGTGGTIAGANLVTANYISGTLLAAASSQPNITSVGTLTSLSVSGNATVGNLIGPLANGNSNVNIPAANGNVNISAVGNANVLVVTGTGANITGTLSASGNLTAANLIGPLASGNSNVTITANANITMYVAGNATARLVATTTGVNVAGTLSASGNLTAANIIGIYANGTSNINIPATNGNVNISSAGNANIVVVTGTGANIAGTLSVSGNANAGNIGATTITGSLVTAAQPNVTSVGTLTALTVGPNSSITLSGTSGYVKANSIYGNDGTAALYPYYNSVAGAVGIRTDLTVGAGGSGNLVANTGKAIFGDPANITITGGLNGYVLSTDGAGNLTWSGAAGGGATITDNTTASSTYYPVYATSSTGSLSVAGITSTKLQFVPSSGQLTVQDLNTLSDATLKENAEIIDDPFVTLKQIFGMSFNWADSGKKSYGVLAQMLEKVLPELVSTNAQGVKTVNYIPIIAFLVEAVKKQQDDIEQLKKR